MPIKNIPSIEDLQSYFNTDLADKSEAEKKAIEKKIKSFQEELDRGRIIPDIKLTNEEQEVKEVLSFKKLGIKNLDAFNKWLAFMDQRNQITSTFVYEPEVDENGIPFLAKTVSTNVFVPKRDKDGRLITEIDPVSGMPTGLSGNVLKQIVPIAIPPIQSKDSLYSIAWMVNNDVHYSETRSAGDTRHNPTKDYIVKQQIRRYDKGVKIVELVDVPIEEYVAEIKDENGNITQSFKPPVVVRFRLEYKKRRGEITIQVAKEEYPRLLTTMQDSMNSWQQSSSEAMTLDAVLQKAAQTLSPEQLAQFLKDSTDKLKDKIKNNNAD